MKKLTTAVLAVLLLMGLALLPACGGGGGGGGSERSLVGTWVCIDSSVAEAVGTHLVLRADFTGNWDGDPISYSHGGGVLIINGMGSTTYALDWVNDNRITISAGDLWLIWVRV